MQSPIAISDFLGTCSLCQFFISHFFPMTSPCTPHQFLLTSLISSICSYQLSELPQLFLLDCFSQTWIFSCCFSVSVIVYATLPDELVIVGDFNFHFDINTDVHVRRFRDLLYSHGLTQYVEVATRQGGHILDLIIARTYSCVVDTVVADLISDHCCTLPLCNAQTSFEEN